MYLWRKHSFRVRVRVEVEIEVDVEVEDEIGVKGTINYGWLWI